jgi:hypothetical protein
VPFALQKAATQIAMCCRKMHRKFEMRCKKLHRKMAQISPAQARKNVLRKNAPQTNILRLRDVHLPDIGKARSPITGPVVL